MSDDFTYADHVLKHLGFEVDPIERGEGQSADWIASIAHEVVHYGQKHSLPPVGRRENAPSFTFHSFAFRPMEVGLSFSEASLARTDRHLARLADAKVLKIRFGWTLCCFYERA